MSDRCARLSAAGVPIREQTTSWLLCAFIDALSLEATLRVWDILFCDGQAALLRVAGASLRALNLNGAFGTEEVSRELILQSCPRLALLDDKGRVRKH